MGNLPSVDLQDKKDKASSNSASPKRQSCAQKLIPNVHEFFNQRGGFLCYYFFLSKQADF